MMPWIVDAIATGTTDAESPRERWARQTREAVRRNNHPYGWRGIGDRDRNDSADAQRRHRELIIAELLTARLERDYRGSMLAMANLCAAIGALTAVVAPSPYIRAVGGQIRLRGVREPDCAARVGDGGRVALFRAT